MKRSGFQIMKRLVVLVKPLRFYMLLAVIMGVLGHLMATFISVLGGFAILNSLNFNVGFSIKGIFVLLLIFALMRGLLRYGEQACNHFIAFKLLALIRDKVFDALRLLTPAKLEGRDKGNLISIITSDIELLEVFYAHTISPICIGAIFSIVMTLFIARYHWILGIIALCAYLSVGLIIPIITSKLSGDNGSVFRNKSGDLASFVLDSLRGLSEILQYGQGPSRIDRVNVMTDSLSSYEKEMKVRTGLNIALTNGIILIFDIVMLIVGTTLCGFEGGLIATLSIMGSFGPLVSLSALGSTLQNTFAAGNRVLDILDEKPIVEEITGKEEVDFTGARTEHITFAYEDETILSDFSVNIPKNKIVGIVGKSGSGKSTLLKLLMRFWKVDDGNIVISDRDINDINTKNLRNMESFVTQETHLFQDSILANLKIAKLDASDEEVIEACKKASVHDFIMSLPKGYHTQVGELGDTLSGGERQRLGLARAFLHDAPFMLFDEPTSNLDSLNEAVILKSLDKESEGKTVVLVSHRKSTVGIADVVYSVEHGRLS